MFILEQIYMYLFRKNIILISSIFSKMNKRRSLGHQQEDPTKEMETKQWYKRIVVVVS